MTFIRKILTDIQSSQSFEGLQPFKDPSTWPSLVQEERLLLAKLLVMQGAKLLSEGNKQVIENFEMAAEVSANSSDIFYQQGVVYASCRENISCLKLAIQAFQKALQHSPLLFDGWIALGEVYILLGYVEKEIFHFFTADEHFSQVWQLLSSSLDANKLPNNNFRQNLLWKWGSSLYGIACYSGEPTDYQKALEKYANSYQLGYQHIPFLNEYSRCLVEVAILLNKQEYFIEAISLLDISIEIDDQCFESWFYRGCCWQHLAEYNNAEKCLLDANADFETATKLSSTQPEVWIKWGEVNVMLSKITQESQYLYISLEKFAQAYALDHNHPQILGRWAEAELALGSQEDRLDLMQSAQVKITKTLTIQPENPDAWYFYGVCLNELGRYFAEKHYFEQAIAKFKQGITLSPHHPLLWYGLALAHFELGELTQEESFYDQSAHCCELAYTYCEENSAQLLNDWGICLLRLAEITEQAAYAELAIQKFELALTHINKHATSNEVHLEWIHHYGCAFDVLGNLTDEPQYFEKAIQIFTQILSADPEFAQARYHMALSLSHLGEITCELEPYYQAVNHFETLIEDNAEDEMIQLDFGITLVNIGLLIQDLHDSEQARVLYRQAENHLMQAAVLGNAQAYYQLSGLYSINEHYEQSMFYLEKAYLFEALPEIEDLLHDDWLDGLRQTTSFQKFFSSLIK